MTDNHSVVQALTEQAAAIYKTFDLGGTSTAAAMLKQVPTSRLPYVMYCLTIIAQREGQTRRLHRFLVDQLA